MFRLAKQLLKPPQCPRVLPLQQHRTAVSDQSRQRRRPKYRPNTMKKPDDKSDWWIIDGEIHEIGENVPIRERFVIPRDNLPNRRRKQLREQFMRRTRLVVKDNELEPFCKKYMQLYNELRENWERLYWDEGYPSKLAKDHANYDSPEEEDDDDGDFSPYRRGRSIPGELQEHGQGRSGQADTWNNVRQIRDKFEYDREKRMRDKAFAPMNMGNAPDTLNNVRQIRDKFEYDREKRMADKAFGPMNMGNSPGDRRSTFQNQPFNAQQYISEDDDV